MNTVEWLEILHEDEYHKNGDGTFSKCLNDCQMREVINNIIDAFATLDNSKIQLQAIINYLNPYSIKEYDNLIFTLDNINATLNRNGELKQ